MLYLEKGHTDWLVGWLGLCCCGSKAADTKNSNTNTQSEKKIHKYRFFNLVFMDMIPSTHERPMTYMETGSARTRVGSITFKMYFNYKIQITFIKSNSNTFQLLWLWRAKYKIHFLKVIKIQNNKVSVIAVRQLGVCLTSDVCLSRTSGLSR